MPRTWKVERTRRGLRARPVGAWPQRAWTRARSWWYRSRLATVLYNLRYQHGGDRR